MTDSERIAKLETELAALREQFQNYINQQSLANNAQANWLIDNVLRRQEPPSFLDSFAFD